jgi:hypothetical protein
MPTNNGDCIPTKANAEKIKIFPANNYWNKIISKAPVHPNSPEIISLFENVTLRADFGEEYGIPYTVVCGNEPKINVTFTQYPDESDPGPYPIPITAPIEGDGTGDAHVISVDIENRVLYELFNARVDGTGWVADCGAMFKLNSNKMRPDNWVSADAAGLPIFPGLVRYDEINTGKIDHAIRFTLNSSNIRPAHIEPARHHIQASGNENGLPFGAKIRLKSGFNIRKFSKTNQIILKAMKKYGLILADVGSDLFISGAKDERWDDDLIKLNQLKGSDFEVVNF